MAGFAVFWATQAKLLSMESMKTDPARILFDTPFITDSSTLDDPR